MSLKQLDTTPPPSTQLTTTTIPESPAREAAALAGKTAPPDSTQTPVPASTPPPATAAAPAPPTARVPIPPAPAAVPTQAPAKTPPPVSSSSNARNPIPDRILQAGVILTLHTHCISSLLLQDPPADATPSPEQNTSQATDSGTVKVGRTTYLRTSFL